MNLKGKTVTVIGLGNSGVNAALLLCDVGAIVRATDSQDTPATRDVRKALERKAIKVEIGGHTESFIKGSGLIVASPGVEDSSPAIKWAAGFSIPIIGEMELGFRFCKGRIIAITGTNGKSTVTGLIGEILKDGGLDAVVCGNIGNSLCGEISRIKIDTWVVLEVSSFQLERIDEFKPKIAVILNVTDDHMDRYTRFSDYFSEKLKIFRNQDDTDVLILNYDAKNLRELGGRTRSRVLFYSRSQNAGAANKIYDVSDMKLKGRHNVENVLASCLVGSVVGVKEDSMRNTIRDFKGLPHRFETIAVIDGVEYIDDSKGTTVDSTVRALESCEKSVILIAGGKDKHSDYSAARDIVREKVRHLILIGEARDAIKQALEGASEIHIAKDMLDAVTMAHGLADGDSVVLLSPMCSSFDMFTGYKERGVVFKRAAMGLKGRLQKA